MKLLQVCNVGDICGGTAACAWSITQALPTVSHAVVFLSRPTEETRRAFSRCRIEVHAVLEPRLVREMDPDVVLLHNTPMTRCGAIEAPLVIQYLHSRITPAPADLTVACSDWLRCQYSPGVVDAVLYQPVECGTALDTAKPLWPRDRLIVGRLCTPTPRKWPRELAAFYHNLATAHPEIDWEFVGCPAERQAGLHNACAGRAMFLPAGPTARDRLHRWDAILYHHPDLTESFGRTAAEGLLAGCIPIVDDRGGFREQITPQSGFLCRSRSDFRAALARLVHPATRRSIARAGRSVALRRFSLTAFASRFRALLQAVADVA